VDISGKKKKGYGGADKHITIWEAPKANYMVLNERLV